MNDRDLIKKAKNDMQEFAPLYDKYYIRVFRFVLSRIGDKDITADLVSETFVKAMAALKNYEDTGKAFVSWLFTIASNEIKMMYRKQSSQQNYVVSMQHVQSFMTEMNFPGEEGINTKPLTQCLEQLPEKDYLLIHQRYFDGLSFKEIAEMTGKTEQSLRVRIHRLKDNLRTKLSKHSELVGLLAGSLLALSLAIF